MKRARISAVAVMVAVVLAACQAAPLDNPAGTKAGLAATGTGDYGTARVYISKVRVAHAGSVPKYERSKFGSGWLDSITPSVPFSRNGCDARNDILNRDLTDKTYKAGTDNCVVMSGKFADPYTGSTTNFTKAQASKVQIDHVVPLSYAWKMGAANWSDAKRRDFANDPINLLASDGPANASKGDKGPSSWMPPNAKVRCSYSIRFAQAAKKYDVGVTPNDRSKMDAACR